MLVEQLRAVREELLETELETLREQVETLTAERDEARARACVCIVNPPSE